MRNRKRRGSELTLNITPLIDVVFLLLIFFMITTSFRQNAHLDIELPKAVQTSAQHAVDKLVIEIDNSGHYAVNGKSLSDIAALRDYLAKLEDRQIPVQIAGDANAPYQAIVSAMDAAGQYGFSKLQIMTKKTVS